MYKQWPISTRDHHNKIFNQRAKLIKSNDLNNFNSDVFNFIFIMFLFLFIIIIHPIKPFNGGVLKPRNRMNDLTQLTNFSWKKYVKIVWFNSGWMWFACWLRFTPSFYSLFKVFLETSNQIIKIKVNYIWRRTQWTNGVCLGWMHFEFLVLRICEAFMLIDQWCFSWFPRNRTTTVTQKPCRYKRSQQKPLSAFQISLTYPTDRSTSWIWCIMYVGRL